MELPGAAWWTSLEWSQSLRGDLWGQDHLEEFSSHLVDLSYVWECIVLLNCLITKVQKFIGDKRVPSWFSCHNDCTR